MTAWFTLENVLITLYLAILLTLALYGFHRSTLVYLYYRNRRRDPEPQNRFVELPIVTIQLPLFNEMYVAPRLLDAVADIVDPTVHLFSDGRVGMVQVRWEHVNRDYSRLTELQAMMLDGQFVIEH